MDKDLERILVNFFKKEYHLSNDESLDCVSDLDRILKEYGYKITDKFK